jgi:CHASE2 domain-containing sensor protein
MAATEPKETGPSPPPVNPLRGIVLEIASEITGRFRDGIVSALLPLVSLVLTAFIAPVNRIAEARPWQALWVTVPAAVVLWLTLQLPGATRRFRPHGGSLWLLMVAGAITMSLMFARSLERPSRYAGLPQDPSLRESAMPFLGDWHYRCARRPPRSPLITIVLLPPAELAVRRLTLARLVRMAVIAGARGIALDVFFTDTTATLADAALTSMVQAARSGGLPVIAGMGTRMDSGKAIEILRTATAPRLAAAFPDSTLGHLMALREGDRRLRCLPLYLEDDPEQPAWSLLVASLVAKVAPEKLRKPEDGVLRFLPPGQDFPIVRIEDLERTGRDGLDHLRRQFVLVGEESPRETFDTPFGRRTGVTIHAWAVNSLLTGRFIHRDQWWVGFLVLGPFLYALAALWSAGITRARLFLWAIALAAVSFVYAAAAIAVSLFWIELTYVVIPVLVFPVALVILAPRRRSRATPRPVK